MKFFKPIFPKSDPKSNTKRNKEMKNQLRKL